MHYSEQPCLELVPQIYELAPEVDTAGSTGNDAHNSSASLVCWLEPMVEAEKLFQTLFDMTMDANQRADWHFEVGILEPLQFTKYGVGEKYDWHVDQLININEETCRKLSFTMLLNDEFEGGDLQLECGSPSNPEREHSVALKKGDIVFFPSYCWHRVLPVTSGERHSLVGWLHGPNWR